MLQLGIACYESGPERRLRADLKWADLVTTGMRDYLVFMAQAFSPPEYANFTRTQITPLNRLALNFSANPSMEQHLMGCALSLRTGTLAKISVLHDVFADVARLNTPYQRHAHLPAGRTVRRPVAFERSGDTFNVKNNVNRLDARGRDPCRRAQRVPRRRI